MGFLGGSGGTDKPKDAAYLEVSEEKLTIRPLDRQPTSVWVHTIPGIKTPGPNGQDITIRKFKTVLCTSTGRGGGGCNVCATKDPLWDRVEESSKYNKKMQRTDFPKKMIHILPVIDHTSKTNKILKGGNQTYEKMDIWFDMQTSDSAKDLRRCDWVIWKTGKGMKTKYFVDRLDTCEFEFDPTDAASAKALIKKAIDDLAAMTPAEFNSAINGTDDDANTNNDMASTNSPPFDVTATPTQSVAVPTAPANVVAAPQVVAKSAAAATSTLTEFTTWLNAQSEFQGNGMVTTLVPLLKEALNGSITYHQLQPDKLSALRTALEEKLTALRSVK